MSTIVPTGRLRHLSLFSGIGGAEYAGMLTEPKWHTVGYVEFDGFCQKVIKQRIKDGVFADAPIFGDIRSFDGTPYRGRTDLITAGFP